MVSKFVLWRSLHGSWFVHQPLDMIRHQEASEDIITRRHYGFDASTGVDRFHFGDYHGDMDR